MRRTMRTAVGSTIAVLAVSLVVLPVPVVAHEGHDHDRGADRGTAQHQAGHAPILPSGFQDREAIPGLSEPTAVAFAPDGTAFIALKSGEIKSFDYDAVSRQFEPFATHTNVINLAAVVHNYWDRGLLGIDVDPQLGTAGHNYIYVNYSFNRDPRDNPAVVPKWNGVGTYDGCPVAEAAISPPTAGCVVSTRVSRIPVVEQAAGWTASGPEQPLVEAACMQFPSHASGDVRFGPDGYLYASTGDGASFTTEDYGQGGNPCNDPDNEGGSLRAQDYRTNPTGGNGDPIGLNGAVWRIKPGTGQAPNDSMNNQDRLVLYGQRNPWRLTFRPGTSELWSADVGGSAWEEINRTDLSTFSTGSPRNLGWPCYEGKLGGAVRQPAWDALNKPICENLYTQVGNGQATVQAPAFSYQTRGATLTSGEQCESTTSSISGVAFAPASSNYPPSYQGGLFFSDFARNCVWRLGKKPNGDPDPAQIVPFVQNASTPVELTAGPDGDLFYVDYGIVDGQVTAQAGAIHRITYQDPSPIAKLTSNRISGKLSKVYRFDASRTRDPNKRAMTFTWDLDGNGTFETSTGSNPRAKKRYGAKVNVTVSVRATNTLGRTDTATLTVYPGDNAPEFTMIKPNRKLTWKVGQKIRFKAKAKDKDQRLRKGAYTWSLAIRHCPKSCHTHPINQWPGRKKGSFRAPDHEYPSHLLLGVSVTDARGLTVRKSVRIDPKTVDLTFATQPAGLRLNAGGSRGRGPFTRTFIVGSLLGVTAAKEQRRHGVTYRFRRWSDGGKRAHDVFAPSRAGRLVAVYRRVS